MLTNVVKIIDLAGKSSVKIAKKQGVKRHDKAVGL